MVKFGGLFLLVVLCLGRVSAQQDEYNTIVNLYVQQYKDIAIKEMKVYREIGRAHV